MELVPVHVETLVAAPVEEVYAAWTHPQKLCSWLCESASGEARPGETLTLSWPSLGQEISLEVLEATPNALLRVSADVGGTAHTQELRFNSAPGGTKLTIRHRAPDEQAHGIESGWKLRLRILEHYLRRGGTRALRTVAGTAIGDESTVFDRLESAVRTHLGEPTQSLRPDGLCGHFSDTILYVVRRFTLVEPSHLIAAQIMSWSGDELDVHQPLLISMIEAIGTLQPSSALH